MRVGVIRCEDQSRRCAGYHCFPAMQNRTGEFKDYDTVELVGFDTCGGCFRGRADRIVTRDLRLKERGAEIIHLGDCMTIGRSSKDVYEQTLSE